MPAASVRKQSKGKKSPVSNLSVAYCLDMSGSMGHAKHAAREGTSNYLRDLKEQEQDLVKNNGEGVYTRFSLTVFDTVFEPWVVDEPVASVPLSAISPYQPRGGTALYDAIANTITSLETKLKAEGRSGEKCLLVVMTDGQENASKEYGGPDGRDRIFKLIKAYEKRGNWTFVYLGANVDAYAESSSMGFTAGNTASYSTDKKSMMVTNSALSAMTFQRRASGMSSSPTSFADAGLVQDYTTPIVTIPDVNTSSVDENSQWSSSSATDATRKAR